MNIVEVHEERAKLKQRLDALDEIEAKLNQLEPRHRIAELLHSNMCTYNHTDMCGWMYDSWEKYIKNGIELSARSRNDPRTTYLRKADALLAAIEDYTDVEEREAVAASIVIAVTTR